MDELARIRALETVREAEHALEKAAASEAKACSGFSVARQARRVVGRAQEKRQDEILDEQDRKERRGYDELATLRFNNAR